jgi:hypothetical protein
VPSRWLDNELPPTPATRTSFEAALFKKLGAEIRDVSLPPLRESHAAMKVAAVSALEFGTKSPKDNLISGVSRWFVRCARQASCQGKKPKVETRAIERLDHMLLDSAKGSVFPLTHL